MPPPCLGLRLSETRDVRGAPLPPHIGILTVPAGPKLYRVWGPHVATRVGEAKTLGRNIKREPPRASGSSQVPLRRRLSLKGPDDAPPPEQLELALGLPDSEVHSIPVPDDGDLAGTRGEQRLALAVEAALAVTPSSLLNFHVRRNMGAPALVSATYSAKKKTWRWQVRAAPAFAGTERAHPKEALAAFWNSHEAKLQAEVKEVIEERIAALAPFSLDAFVPKAGKRVCRDPDRHELPPLPPEEIADTNVADTQHWQQISWAELEELITAKVPTQRFISPTLLSLTGDVVCALVNASRSPDEQPPFSALLLVLSKLLWPTRALGPRGTKVKGKQRQRIFGEKLRKARLGQWRTLFDEAMRCQCDYVHQDELMDEMEDEHSLPLSEHEAKLLLFAVKKGQPGSAVRRLDSAPNSRAMRMGIGSRVWQYALIAYARTANKSYL